ncbi:hypothetical protein ACGF8B_35310 [Streptomyces sp. NPDC047917]|uniref:hypothetical protein n=1 Tax=Streptomyces sp. NPDC047917 TaxID=3365491 RepID=UPI00371838C3
MPAEARPEQRVVYLRDRDDGQRMKDVVYVHPPSYKGAEFPNPAGLPRPVVAGLPFPWVTPMGTSGPLFREVERVKAELCRRLWGCQVCGNDLDTTAWVALERPEEGSPVITSSAIHRTCLRLAVRHCPVLGNAANGYTFTEVFEDDIATAAGEHNHERAPKARWYLRPVAETSQPDRPRAFLSLPQVLDGS